MVNVRCEAPKKVKLQELTPFQGDLKKRTQQDVDELKQSIHDEGLLMPFAVWEKGGKKYLLDGHGRLEALIRYSLEDPEVITQDFPCVVIQADKEEDARKALLQITSQYGKTTKKGIAHFTASIPEYHAPIVAKFSRPSNRKLVERDNRELIRIYVRKDRAEAVRSLLKNTEGIEVI